MVDSWGRGGRAEGKVWDGVYHPWAFSLSANVAAHQLGWVRGVLELWDLLSVLG